jgi:hypothetical protein
MRAALRQFERYLPIFENIGGFHPKRAIRTAGPNRLARRPRPLREFDPP